MHNAKNGLMKALLTALLVISAFSGSAHAALLTYTLQDVKFTDGAVATGSFTFDAVTHQGGAFDVSITGGILSALEYTNANSSFFYGVGVGPNNFILFDIPLQRYFNFSFLSPLTNAGGTFELNLPFTYECNNCSAFRIATSGSVTSQAPGTVPEPGTVALLGLGLLGFVASRRKIAKTSNA
jgi:hypothetical protein